MFVMMILVWVADMPTVLVMAGASAKARAGEMDTAPGMERYPGGELAKRMPGGLAIQTVLGATMSDGYGDGAGASVGWGQGSCFFSGNGLSDGSGWGSGWLDDSSGWTPDDGSGDGDGYGHADGTGGDDE